MSQDAYTSAGVSQSGADAAVDALVAHLARIDTGKPSRVVPLPGHYASVLRLDERTGIAFGTDGVGTKMVVAEQLGRFETIGIDCIAMNVNDLICVGAEPIALVDFILCPTADPEHLRRDRRGAAPRRRAGRDRDPRRRDRPGRRRRQRPRARRQRDRHSCALDGIVTGAVDRAGRRRDRPPLLGPALERLHARPQGPRRHPARRRAPRPAARRDPARADRDLRPADPRAARLRASTSAASPTSPATASTTCSGSARASATRSTTRCPPQPIFEPDRRARRRSTTTEMHEVFNMGCGFCVTVPAADLDAALALLHAALPGGATGRHGDRPRRHRRPRLGRRECRALHASWLSSRSPCGSAEAPRSQNTRG